MAAEITHILVADKLFDQYFSDKNKADFYIGCCLPDIRYIAPDIKRSATHLPVKNIDDVISEPNALFAGMKFHNLTDHRRNQFIESRANIYQSYDNLPFIGGSTKLLEDMVLYNRIQIWDKIIQLFNSEIQSQLPDNIPSETIAKYNQILAKYFRKPPSLDTISDLVREFGFNDNQIADATSTIKQLRSDPAVVATINEMYENIEEIITQ